MGNKNITNVPSADRKKKIFPPLHIKLGLIKKFFEALHKKGNCFQYIKASIPSVNE